MLKLIIYCWTVTRDRTVSIIFLDPPRITEGEALFIYKVVGLARDPSHIWHVITSDSYKWSKQSEWQLYWQTVIRPGSGLSRWHRPHTCHVRRDPNCGEGNQNTRLWQGIQRLPSQEEQVLWTPVCGYCSSVRMSINWSKVRRVLCTCIYTLRA